jgi:hypothetical protein
MPGIAPLGKLFFWFFWTFQQPKNRSAGKQPLYLCLSRACPRGGPNHKENNPAHIEVEEQTFDRAG